MSESKKFCTTMGFMIISFMALSMTAVSEVRAGVADDDHKHEPSSFDDPDFAPEGARLVTVFMNDMSFSPKSITVEQGETIHFRVINKSKTVHDFTLGDEKTQLTHRKEMANKGHSMNHEGSKNSVIVNPGDKKELFFTFSGRDQLQFACNVLGHFEAGMKGDIVINPKKN